MESNINGRMKRIVPNFPGRSIPRETLTNVRLSAALCFVNSCTALLRLGVLDNISDRSCTSSSAVFAPRPKLTEARDEGGVVSNADAKRDAHMMCITSCDRVLTMV